jgi:hypothetical protein
MKYSFQSHHGAVCFSMQFIRPKKERRPYAVRKYQKTTPTMRGSAQSSTMPNYLF